MNETKRELEICSRPFSVSWLPIDEIVRLALGRIGDDDVAEADRGVGEVHLELVAEAARDGAFGAEPDAAGAGVEAEVAGDQRAVGVVVRVADVAGVPLDAGRAA